MKKSPLVVVLPVLALSALLLSGCGMFRSQKQWETAKQESPLEIPPGLDTPNSSAALVIPEPGANNPTSNGATARVGQNTGAAVIADGFVLGDSVDSAYRRVGQALEQGDIGQVVAHDDDAHTYTLAVVASGAPAQKSSFFGRMFGSGKKDEATAPTAPAAKDAGGATGPAPRQVQVTINASGQTGSEIRAQGDAAAVAKVIDSLKSRLGG
ncbi:MULTISPECIES: hypothetical protein [Dyella]|uniref:Outer membrane protein assembly factor BamC n=2 Tax=Dyella TaxID=231454 RepID=A0A4R0YVL9_9GAMM|nr:MULTISPECIES: hypothetical protein [Dyella]TBR39006.1 hypothetical protein EYV96_01805 [Dyella terrae]TCI13402.1 hypothetical protein EZM97_09065 [Dyella soli]